jgi:predicted transposase YbfD/YdcC
MESFFKIFENLEDPRDNRGKKHLLIHIIVLSIYGILCGYDDFTNMAYFLKKQESVLSEKLKLLNGIPSHDTFSAVFRIIDPNNFIKLFIDWTKQMFELKGKHIAIDGKAVAAATDKVNNGNIPYVVSAFLTDIGISIGQYKIDEKTNEIKGIPELLDIIDIKDSTITIDAIGTQKVIVEKIIKKEGHYCLSVKKNHKLLYDDINTYYQDAIYDNKEIPKMSYYETLEKGHGRIEKRKYYIVNDLSFVLDRDNWRNLKSVGMVIQERTIGDKTSKEIQYHILDQILTAKDYERYTRSHWKIENNLHWILDVIFNEDHSLAKKNNAIHNLTLLRKIVFNFTKLDPSMEKKTTKKKIIDYTFDFSTFEKLIYEFIPTKL